MTATRLIEPLQFGKIHTAREPGWQVLDARPLAPPLCSQPPTFLRPVAALAGDRTLLLANGCTYESLPLAAAVLDRQGASMGARRARARLLVTPADPETDAGPPGNGDPGDGNDGCGCSAATTPSDAAWHLFLALCLFLVLRRQRAA